MIESTIKDLFEPQSIAIIGASADSSKIGYKILDNIISGGFKGKIYPINPKGGEILGLTVYKSISEIKEPIDSVTICIPAPLVIQAVKECVEAKAKFISIITSGFAEISNTNDEKAIQEIAKQNGIRILGPNIFGVYSAKASLNATFGPKNIKKGNVAFITQSGALGIALMGKTQTEGIGLSLVVSEGNKCDLDESDILEYLLDDSDTKAIFMYLEGIKNGQRLISVLKRLTRIKPVIVIKSGVSEKGALAVASHTGSLAGLDIVFSEIMKQCGVIRAKTVQEAINLVKYLSSVAYPAGKNSLIITNGGGIGVLATDACDRFGVDLYDDLEKLKLSYGHLVPTFGSTKNPIDLTGQATFIEYEKALNTAIDDPIINSVICLGCETAVFDTVKLSKVIKTAFEKSKAIKPLVFSFVGGKKTKDDLLNLKDEGLPIYGETNDAVNCLGKLYSHLNYLQAPLDNPLKISIDIEKIKLIINGAKSDHRKVLLADEAKVIMDVIGIPSPKNKIVKDINEAIKYANEITYPVVAKVVSKDIIHKTEAGGVILGIKSDEEMKVSYQQIIDSCLKYNSQAVIEGVDIIEQAKEGLETIIGARKDPAFGNIVMFGLGGIYVQVVKDISFRALPVGEIEAYRMIKQLKSAPLFEGVRGQSSKDSKSIVEAILKIGTILEEIPEISDIEINPLVVYNNNQGTMALDVRIILN